jgi:hypothetical protein
MYALSALYAFITWGHFVFKPLVSAVVFTWIIMFPFYSSVLTVCGLFDYPFFYGNRVLKECFVPLLADSGLIFDISGSTF